MKKFLTVLCALLLVPTLATANSNMVSISELRQQVGAMGRWIQTYTDQKGRTVDVDISPILPDIEAVPVITVQKPENARQSVDRVCIPSMTTEKYEDDAIVVDYANADTGDQMKIQFFEITDQMIRIEYQNTKTKMQSDPNAFETTSGRAICSNEVDWAKAYLDGYDLTPQEAVEHANNEMTKLFPNWNLQLEAEWIEIVNNSVPLYVCEMRQRIEDIPVLIGAQSPVIAVRDSEFKKPKIWGKIGNSRWGDFRMPTWGFHYWVDGSYSFIMVPLLLKDVLETDVPLSSFERVIQSIEAQIEAGHIRQIYALRFGYCCYEGKSGETELHPVWEVECEYYYSAKTKTESYDERYGEIPVTSELYYRTMIVNAQTGEFVDPAKLMDRVFDCPDTITWEDVQ